MTVKQDSGVEFSPVKIQISLKSCVLDSLIRIEYPTGEYLSAWAGQYITLIFTRLPPMTVMCIGNKIKRTI